MDDSLSDTIQIEVEITDGNEDIFPMIQEMACIGGKTRSFYEKEISLKELFPMILDRGNIRTGE